MKFNFLCVFFISLIVSCLHKKDYDPQPLSDAELEHIPEGFVMPKLRTFVINLDNDAVSEKRLGIFSEQFKHFPFEFERFPAVNGRAYKGHYKIRGEGIQILDKEKGYSYKYDANILEQGLRPSQLGVYFSHYELLRIALNEEVTMIFEDDAFFYKRFPQRLKSLIANAPKDWDILYLHCFQETPQLCDLKKFPLIRRRYLDLSAGGRCVAGGAGYLVNPRGAKKALKDIIPASNTSDDRMLSLQNMNKKTFKTYCAFPQLMIQDDKGISTIKPEL